MSSYLPYLALTVSASSLGFQYFVLYPLHEKIGEDIWKLERKIEGNYHLITRLYQTTENTRQLLRYEHKKNT